MSGRIGCPGCKRWGELAWECSGAADHCQMQREERSVAYIRVLKGQAGEDQARSCFEAEEAVRRAEHSVILAARRYGDRPTKAARDDLIADAMALRRARMKAAGSAALADKDSNG